ncbi:MAG: transcriptional regulator [Fluviicola sp.]|nr:MAG: transcriptional regulator [Fluviicola sp.]
MSNSCIRIEADIEQINKCKLLLEEQSQKIESMTSVLNLVGNTVRFNILYLLQKEGRLCVCDLSDILGISISAVSQHLRKLKDRQIIYSVKEGQTIYYSNNEAKSHLLDSFFSLLTDETKTELV